MKTSPYQSAPARLPHINIPSGADPQVRQALEAIKERLEVREGSRGNPYERAVTLRDLEALRADLTAGTKTAKAAPTQVIVERSSSGPSADADAASLRAEIVAAERRITDNMLATLSSATSQAGISAIAVAARSAAAARPYTAADLSADLASGGALIISGALNGTTVMELDPAGNYVLFKHRLANPTASVGAYTGTLRTATGLTAAGFIAGYNRKSDGAWQTSIAIDSSTGDVTIQGTLKAGSVIELGTLVGAGGNTIGSIDTTATNALSVANSATSTANTANSTANSAYSEAVAKLSPSSSYTLTGTVSLPNSGGIKTGTVTWDTTTGAVTGGSGLVMTGSGIIGAKSGVTTFAVTNAGDATFSGTINGGASINISGQAYFAGMSTGSVNVGIGGSLRNIEYSSWSNAIGVTSASSVRAGVVGFSNSSTAFRSVGVAGIGTSAVGSVGIGVVGEGNLIGGYFASATADGTALELYHPSPTGMGLICPSKIKWGTYTYSVPSGTGGLFMRDDGTWGAASGPAGPTGPQGPQGIQGPQGPAGADGTSTTLGGYAASEWARIFTANSGTANASGFGVQLLGSTSTGIASAYVGTNGFSNIVMFDIRTTSPSDARLKADVVNMPLGLDFVRQLRPVEYRLKADPTRQKGYGFIAQEVEQLGVAGTSLVYDDPDYQTGTVKGHKVIHYPSYIAVLTKAVQELAARLETLENA